MTLYVPVGGVADQCKWGVVTSCVPLFTVECDVICTGVRGGAADQCKWGVVTSYVPLFTVECDVISTGVGRVRQTSVNGVS